MSAGKKDEIKGRLKEAAGSLTDDDDLKREGRIDQGAAKLKEKVDEAVDRAKELVTGDEQEERD